MSSPISKGALWGGRVASALPVLMLVMSGGMKLSHAAQVVEPFTTKFGFAKDNPHPLLERFIEAVAQIVLTEFGAPALKLRVAKLAPLPGVREIGIEIERAAR